MRGGGNKASLFELGEDLRWASQVVNKFEYRKTFGLTQEEFERETLDEYFTNIEIISARNELEKRERERAKRKHGKTRKH